MTHTHLQPLSIFVISGVVPAKNSKVIHLDSKLTAKLSAWLVVLVKVFRSTTTIALETLLSRVPIDIRAEICAYMLQLQTDSLEFNLL